MTLDFEERFRIATGWYEAGYKAGLLDCKLSSIIFCRMCKCFGKEGKPFCTKFDFFDESMLDGKGFCYWGERV